MVNADMTHAYIHRTVLYPSLTGPTVIKTWLDSAYVRLYHGDVIYSTTKLHGRRGVDTNAQTGILPKGVVPYAFRDLMIHGNLQFTLRIAVRCALHHCGCQGIRGLQLFFDFFSKI